jgi:hypothetical protein
MTPDPDARFVNDIMARLASARDMDKVEARLLVFRAQTGLCRGAIYAWGKPPASPDPHAPQTADLAVVGTATLAVGEKLLLEIRPPASGYLTVFHLGSSGRIVRLFPGAGSRADNRVAAGRVYTLPGDLLPAVRLGGAWIQRGPATAVSGLPERLLAIVTREPVDLLPRDLHEDLPVVPVRGGLGSVEEVVARLFQLPAEAWGYGLVQAEVVP